MALATTTEMQAYVAEQVKIWHVEQERLLRSLLEQWVSELEPVVQYDYALGIPVIRGLGIADDPTGATMLANPKYRPAHSILRRFSTPPHS